jgi:hypothetical protein
MMPQIILSATADHIRCRALPELHVAVLQQNTSDTAAADNIMYYSR